MELLKLNLMYYNIDTFIFDFSAHDVSFIIFAVPAAMPGELETSVTPLIMVFSEDLVISGLFFCLLEYAHNRYKFNFQFHCDFSTHN